MPRVRQIDAGIHWACLALWVSVAVSVRADDQMPPQTLTWSLRDEFRTNAARENPNSDRNEQPVWHFLRTTRSEGPVESRQWLRDGRYVPLAEQGANLFGSPLDGWAYRANDPLAPVIGKLAAEYDIGLKFAPGNILVAPGPDHAIVIGWRSPVSGKLEVHGSFEHGQSCCGVNSRIRWFVERGPAPDAINGFTPTPLVSGESDFGTATQRGTFEIRDQAVKPDDYVYFIVDAFSDGTATPHHGDGTRLEVNLTVRDVVVPPPPSFEKDVLAKLEPQGLSFSSDAEKDVLIRRAYLDLIGLPPEPTEVQAFLDDNCPDAYERMIDELLESPHYGERWGRHWLDAAGYVDGKLDNDLGTIYPNNGIWRYRDYVIRAFNDDKPFDQFLTEQLAGDELADWRRAETFDERTVSLLTATGFLRNVDDHTDFDQYGIDKRYEVVNETLDMFSTAILGLTFECCRCHNHKYDPLPQRDYYRLMACFEPAFNPHAWKKPKERYLADVSPSARAAIDQRNAEVDQQVAELTKAEATLRQQTRQRVLASRLNALPDEIRADVQQAVELAPDKRNDAQKALAAKREAALKITDADVEAALTDAEKATLTSSAAQRAALASQKKTYGVIQALWDVGPPPASYVHRRGNVRAQGVLVQPGFPEILQPVAQPANPPSANRAAKEIQGETSGRRLALARWLTQPDHPLTARVFVNRVSVPDLHATILHQLGIDHTKLTFTHRGRPERLTDSDVTGARVVQELLA